MLDFKTRYAISDFANNLQQIGGRTVKVELGIFGELFLGPDGLGLGFGTITVIDDLLTIDSKLGFQSLGKAQGVYVSSSADGSRQMMTFTAMMEGVEYGDSINFFGVYHIGSAMSWLLVTGGTGKFLHACGFAEVRSLIPAGQIVADGVESQVIKT